MNQQPKKDYYKIIGVHPQSSPETIEAVFRMLAKRYHPDINKDPSASEKMKEINDAYDTLKDPSLKAEYDKEYGYNSCFTGTSRPHYPQPSPVEPTFWTSDDPVSLVPQKKIFAMLGGIFFALVLLGLISAVPKSNLFAHLPSVSEMIPDLPSLDLANKKGNDEKDSKPASATKQANSSQTNGSQQSISPSPTSEPNSTSSNNNQYSQAENYPTRCRQSAETRFVPGMEGITIVDPGWWIALLPSPTAIYGPQLATGTRFRTTDVPVCAYKEGSPSKAEILWWPVVLLSGNSAGVEGWIGESYPQTDGRYFYTIRPD